MVHCPETRMLQDKWPKLKLTPKPSQEYWLRVIASSTDFAAFLEASGFFKTICPLPQWLLQHQEATKKETEVAKSSERDGKLSQEMGLMSINLPGWLQAT